MCQQCQQRETRDKAMWEGVLLGLVGIQRAISAIIKAVEKAHGVKAVRQ